MSTTVTRPKHYKTTATRIPKMEAARRKAERTGQPVAIRRLQATKQKRQRLHVQASFIRSGKVKTLAGMDAFLRSEDGYVTLYIQPKAQPVATVSPVEHVRSVYTKQKKRGFFRLLLGF